jgi:Mg-chelatase subunit ChlD
MKKTEIIVIADESGSMFALRNDADGGFASFIKEQAEIPGECKVTLTKFNSQARVIYQGCDVKHVKALELRPSGNTALYDAIGNTLISQGKRIEEEKWAELVVLVIITDGQENASREYNLDTIKLMIAGVEAQGWQVIYLASNQDAFAASQAIGSQSHRTKTVAQSGVGQAEAYSYASVETRNLRTEK